MKLSRLIQPRNPRFWLMLALNALSTLLAWVARSQPLSTLGTLLVLGFALGNAVLGMALMWGLLREPEGPGQSREGVK